MGLPLTWIGEVKAMGTYTEMESSVSKPALSMGKEAQALRKMNKQTNSKNLCVLWLKAGDSPNYRGEFRQPRYRKAQIINQENVLIWKKDIDFKALGEQRLKPANGQICGCYLECMGRELGTQDLPRQR